MCLKRSFFCSVQPVYGIFEKVLLVLLFVVEINYRNKIIKLIDDFCEVLGVPLNDLR